VLEDEVSSSNGSTINGAGAIYKLSNSTSLYAQYARSNNKGTSGMAAYGYGFANNNSLSGGQATFPSVMNSSGTTQTAIAMGIQHRF
jgi:predicted porin